MWQRRNPGSYRVFITFMTYPAPSGKNNEIVCTAGIGEDGRWIRIYPVDYRYLDAQRKYAKWQWILADLGEPSNGDQRRESHKINIDTIQLQDIWNSQSDKDWELRRGLIDPMPVHTYLQLRQMWEADQLADRPRTSLGVVEPTEILDLTVEKRDEPDWSDTDLAKLSQLRIFGPQVEQLRKLPVIFRVKFRCKDSEKPHEIMIEDWETGVLFWNCRWKGDSEEAAIAKVREKYVGDVLNLAKRDVRLFMGTIMAKNTWLVIGVFAPPKRKKQVDMGRQQSLFDPA
jgi:hypothetical protein